MATDSHSRLDRLRTTHQAERSAQSALTAAEEVTRAEIAACADAGVGWPLIADALGISVSGARSRLTRQPPEADAWPLRRRNPDVVASPPPVAPAPPGYSRKKDVSQALGVSRMTVDAWVKSGRLHADVIDGIAFVTTESVEQQLRTR